MTDAVVLGANPSGLAIALLLARARRSVVLVEERDVPGGLFARETFHPGYRAPGAVLGPTRVWRRTIARLDLERHGLALTPHPEPVHYLEPGAAEGPALVLGGDPDRERAAIAARHPAEGAAFGAWRAFVGRVAPAVRGLLLRPAPDPFSASVLDLARLFQSAFGLRRLGARDMLELLRVAPMCAADWFGETLRAPHLIAALASRGLRGGPNGPWAPHTAGLCLLTECAGDATVVGGPAALAEALARAAASAGVEIRTGRSVAELAIERGAVRGVALQGGETIAARLVVSALDPLRTLRALVHPRHLAPRCLAEIGSFRARGSIACLRLALSGAPRLRRGPLTPERVAITGDADALERCFDGLKYGRLPERPWLDVHVPTFSDPSLAPAGHHVLAAEVHGVPRALAGGWTPEARARLADSALAVLEEHFELPRPVLARELLAPEDLERRYGLSGGHVLHGEHSFDQLLSLRPSASSARHATPIAGLYLCGPGTHPGGFVALGSVPLVQRVLRV